MPEVGGKKYPYTKAGYKAAAAAREKLESDDSSNKNLQKVVRNPAPHKPKTDNAVPRSSNPHPTGTSIHGSSGSMGGEGGVKPRGPKEPSVKSLQKFWQNDIDIWKADNLSDDERTALKYQTRGRGKSIIEQRKPAVLTAKDPNKPEEGEWTGGKWVTKYMLIKDHLPIPPRQGEVWDGFKHRWVRQENVGRTVAEVQGEKRFRGSGTGTQQRKVGQKQPLTSRRYFARGTKGVVSRRGTPSKRTARATRGPRARRKY
tara:strand:+ start:748 stop:1521 length:774 start_codon:yes stop_codon:yes gene_type:complete